MEDHAYGVWSLLPPLTAIVLSVITRRVIVSLAAGVFVGTLLLAGGNPLAALWLAGRDHLGPSLVDVQHLQVFAFTLLMGAMVGVVHRSGGMHAIVDHLAPLARSRRGGQFITWLLGLIIFFDDYANTLLLGTTMRPLADRLRISREKLAYLVDSTAAPVAGLALVSTWVAGEIGYIQDGLNKLELSGPAGDAFTVFVSTIPYRFYVLWALLFVPLVAWMRRDFGPMLRAERAVQEDETDSSWTRQSSGDGVDDQGSRTRQSSGDRVDDQGSRTRQSSGDRVDDHTRSLATSATRAGLAKPDDATAKDVLDPDEDAPRHWSLAVAPIGVTVVVIVGYILVTGWRAVQGAPPGTTGWIHVVGNGDSYMALIYGSLAGLLLAAGLAWIGGTLSLRSIGRASMFGARLMLPALIILWLAWSLSQVCDSEFLKTGDYLGGLLTQRIPPFLLPTLVFLIASVVAFATGTSWGTMGILMPLVIPLTHQILALRAAEASVDEPLFLATVGSVLAGAIFGDHCSPISDTTILSSQASGCHHLAHVATQLPYALLVAVVSVLLGTLPIGLGVNAWVLLPLGPLALALCLWLLGRRV